MRDITTMEPVRMRFGQGPRTRGRWVNVWLGAISLVLISGAVALTPSKVKPPSRSIVQDTFAQRYVEEGLPVAMTRVRTIPIARTPVEIAPDDANVTELPLPVVNTPRKAKPAADVCRRHGMKKVMVGKFRWRCRR